MGPKATNAITIALILVSFAIALYLYFSPSFPDVMASHWNYKGEVNGTMPKLWGLFLLPSLMLVLYLLFLVIPLIDPLRANIAKFRDYFDLFIAAITLFMLYIYVLTILWSLGLTFDMNMALVPALALLFYFMGALMENTKRNWFIGLRTPWTLSSDEVWEKTNRRTGFLFKLCGLISLVGLLWRDYTLLFVIIPVLFVAAYGTIYSYLLFNEQFGKSKIKRGKK